MDQPSLGMPSKDYYLKERNDTVLMAYQTMITDMAIAFGADKATAETDAKDMVDLERELANVSEHSTVLLHAPGALHFMKGGAGR